MKTYRGITILMIVTAICIMPATAVAMGADGYVELVWKFNGEGGIIYGTPAEHDGVIYFSAEKNVYAIKDGKQVWRYDSPSRVRNDLTYCDGRVYFGDLAGSVTALDAETGEFIWSYITDGPIYSKQCVHNGRVYATSTDGHLYCFDMKGDVVWKFGTNDSVKTGPIGYGDDVYFYSDNLYVYSLKADSGKLNWKTQVIGQSAQSIKISGGKLYFSTLLGGVYGIDAKTGRPEWKRFEGDQVSFSDLTLDGNNLYIVEREGTLYSINPFTGGFYWSNNTSTRYHLLSGVYVHDGKVLVLDRSGDLIAADQNTGEIFSKTRLTNNGTYGKYLKTDSGMLYLGDHNSTLYAYKLKYPVNGGPDLTVYIAAALMLISFCAGVALLILRR